MGRPVAAERAAGCDGRVPEPTTLRDAAADLILGARCVGCDRPGRLLCPACAATLPTAARIAWPTPTPPGLAPPFVTGEYADLLRALVLGLKERRLWGLGRPLGTLLAQAAAAALHDVPTGDPVVLVPVPSRRSSVRQRGLDSTAAVTSHAARVLRAQGRDVVPERLLRTRPGLLDQAGLDAAARAANLAGSITCPAPGLARLARRRPRAHVLICDDVITTGATAREAQRALEAVGLPVRAVACVAATSRRSAR